MNEATVIHRCSFQTFSLFSVWVVRRVKINRSEALEWYAHIEINFSLIWVLMLS